MKVEAQGSAAPAALLAKAAVPAPSTRRRPWGRPGPPSSLTAQPHSDGSITLRWQRPGRSDGSNGHAGATIYLIERMLEHAGAQRRPLWRHLSDRSTRMYRDTTVPAGAIAVHYRLTAMRSGQQSTSVQTVVYYGRR